MAAQENISINRCFPGFFMFSGVDLCFLQLVYLRSFAMLPFSLPDMLFSNLLFFVSTHLALISTELLGAMN